MSIKSLRGLLEDVEGITDTGLVELTDGSVVEYLSCDIASFSRKRCGNHSGIYVIYDTEQGKFLIGRINDLYMNVKTKLGTLRRRTNGNDEAYAWYSQYAAKGLRVLWIYIADSDLRKRVHEGVLQHDKLAATCLNQYGKQSFDGIPESGTMTTVAVYKLTHVPTGYFYVGSSGDVRNRVTAHLSHLKLNRSACSKLQAHWNTHPTIAEWKLTYEEVGTRKEALALEQTLLDAYWDSGKLLNSSRLAIPVITNHLTPEAIARRNESLRATVSTDEFRAKRSAVSKRTLSDPTVLAKLSGDNCKTARAVFIDDVRYCTVREAVKQTGLSNKVIRRKANDSTCLNVRWESETLRVKAVDRTGSKNPLAKRVFVNGIEYGSLIEAARGLGCGVDKLKRLMRLNPSSYYFIS